MLDKFWESIGSNLAERWLEYIFGPAFLFWAAGLGIYVWQHDLENIQMKLQALAGTQQVVWISVALLVLVFSSLLMQSIRYPGLRLMEGYWPWPFNHVARAIVALRRDPFSKKYEQLRELKALESKDGFDHKQRKKLIELDSWAHWHPAKADDLLATSLGNTLRSREQSSERKYGLDAVVCFPRLWFLLPENVRGDLEAARSSLDRLVELWYWGLLFLLWTLLTPWAVVISVLWMVLIYSMAIQSAMTYGDLLESAFDLHRLSLYDSLGWPRPRNAHEEKSEGLMLTEFLWRGTLPEAITLLKKGS